MQERLHSLRRLALAPAGLPRQRGSGGPGSWPLSLNLAVERAGFGLNLVRAAQGGHRLDTSVISALAPGRDRRLRAELASWLQDHHRAGQVRSQKLPWRRVGTPVLPMWPSPRWPSTRGWCCSLATPGIFSRWACPVWTSWRVGRRDGGQAAGRLSGQRSGFAAPHPNPLPAGGERGRRQIRGFEARRRGSARRLRAVVVLAAFSVLAKEADAVFVGRV